MVKINGIAKTINQHSKLTLEQMQKLVGGDIEVYYLPEDKTNIICNANGKLLSLAMNHTATNIFHENFPHLIGIDWIVGDALILHGEARIRNRR